jgi:oleate hydratase
MFYSNGNYEAFIRPRKPKGVDGKSAYLVGGGIASLAAAAFFIRDGQMDGKRITIYEGSKRGARSAAAASTASRTPRRASSSAASARWRTTTCACGT